MSIINYSSTNKEKYLNITSSNLRNIFTGFRISEHNLEIAAGWKKTFLETKDVLYFSIETVLDTKFVSSDNMQFILDSCLFIKESLELRRVWQVKYK